jgi:predicted kinase
MTRLVITRGLPGSGKTTFARTWVARDPYTRARCNRDDLRDNLFGARTGWPEHEDAVTLAQHAAVRALLRAGYNVVCDDTNLNEAYIAALRRIAAKLDATVSIYDLTDVPIEVCIERDRARGAAGGRTVGEAVIRQMWAEYQSTEAHP